MGVGIAADERLDPRQEQSGVVSELRRRARRTSRVYWDEYFHGARASMISYFANGPLPWAGLQIGIAFIAVLFTFSRRSGADAHACDRVASFAAGVRRNARRSLSIGARFSGRPWRLRTGGFGWRCRANLRCPPRRSCRNFAARPPADSAGRKRRFWIHSPAPSERCAISILTTKRRSIWCASFTIIRRAWSPRAEPNRRCLHGDERRGAGFARPQRVFEDHRGPDRRRGPVVCRGPRREATR